MVISATLAIDEETERRRRAGRPVLPLGFGEAGLPVAESLQRALAEHAGSGSYGPVAGIPELRTAAAGYWDRRGLPTDSEQVIAGPGSKPLLLALMIALEGPVALPRPSWVSYAAQAALIGREAVYVATRTGQGGVPDPDRLDALATRARKDGRPLAAVILTLPDNPTGTLAAESTVRGVCDVAERHDLMVISDEIYRDLVHEEQASYLSPAEVIPHRTVVTSGLSKSLAVGGWRIGVARLPDGPRGTALTAEVASIASEVWSVPAVPVQQAAAWAFTEPECLRQRVRLSRRLHGRVALAVADEFRGAGAKVPQPHGGFYCYPDFEGHRDRLRTVHGVEDGPGLATALLEGPGIATLPGSAFGDAISALRLRVATSRLYGPTSEQQEDALDADDPLELPWIAAQLASLRDGLDRLLGT